MDSFSLFSSCIICYYLVKLGWINQKGIKIKTSLLDNYLVGNIEKQSLKKRG